MIHGQPVTVLCAGGEVNIDENGFHDVQSYAGANVQVQPRLMWENSDPTAEFPEQEITMPGIPCKDGYYIIEIAAGISAGDRTSKRLFVLAPFELEMNGDLTVYKHLYVTSSASRTVASIKDDVVNFGPGFNGSVGNTQYGIPTRIWSFSWPENAPEVT